MNPNISEPSFELPAPLNSGNGEAAPSKQEAKTASNLERPAATSRPASVVPQAPTAPMPSRQPQDNVQKNTAMPKSPAVADDNDLIEKEWVQKAKQIVTATKDDPYTQNKEITKFKADYLKKRYNKDVKLEDA